MCPYYWVRSIPVPMGEGDTMLVAVGGQRERLDGESPGRNSAAWKAGDPKGGGLVEWRVFAVEQAGFYEILGEAESVEFPVTWSYGLESQRSG